MGKIGIGWLWIVVACAGLARAQDRDIAGGPEATSRGELDRFLYEVLRAEEADRIDGSEGWRVQDLVVELDSLTVTFEEGTFYPRASLAGDVYGALYLGTGRWQFATEVTWEADSLHRRTRHESLDEPFTDALLQFSPDFLARLGPRGAAPSDVAAEDELNETWRTGRTAQRESIGSFDAYLARYEVSGYVPETVWIDVELTLPIEGSPHADVAPRRYSYLYLGDSRLPVHLHRYGGEPGSAGSDDGTPQLLCQLHRAWEREGLTRAEQARQEARLVDVVHVDASFSIQPGAKKRLTELTGDATVTFVPQRGPQRVFWLALSSRHGARDVRVDSVMDGDGSELPFFHEDALLAFELPEPAEVGEPVEVRVVYRGSLLSKLGHVKRQWAGVGTNIVDYTLTGVRPWFPKNYDDQLDRHTWTWRIDVPEKVGVASSGTTTSDEVVGDLRRVVVQEDFPSYHPAVVVGRYDSVVEETLPDGGPRIRVFAFRGQRATADDMLVYTRTLIQFYEQLFGEAYPYRELDLVQAPVGIGEAQAPPGLILVDGIAYMDKDVLVRIHRVTDFMGSSLFMPHEVAHQWWGHLVSLKTPRDIWLMEALTETSAALYQESLAGLENRRRYLMYWGFQARGYDTDLTMPPWTAATHGEGLVQLRTIYARGPLLMQDLRATQGADAFVGVLRSLIQRHAGRRFTTEDFRSELERTFGRSFEGYFENHVYGNQPLPEHPSLRDLRLDR